MTNKNTIKPAYYCRQCTNLGKDDGSCINNPCDCQCHQSKKEEGKTKIEELKLPISFGAAEATWTDINNALVPYYNKINEIIKYLNE